MPGNKRRRFLSHERHRLIDKQANSNTIVKFDAVKGSAFLEASELASQPGNTIPQSRYDVALIFKGSSHPNE